MKKILLDTCAYIEFMNGDKDVFSALSTADRVYFSAVSIGEVLSGLERGVKGSGKKKDLLEFLRLPTVNIHGICAETAEFYAAIFSDLKRNGTPIPINDVWIGACAAESGSVVVTYDRHFLKIPGLRVWDEINTSPV